MDKVIVIECDEKKLIDRVLKKKKYSKEEIKNITKSQMPLKEKIKYADFVIDNSYPLAKTKNQVKEIIKQINAQ